MATNFSIPVANSRVPAQTVEVSTQANDASLDLMANAMAIGLTAQNPTLVNIMSMDDLKANFNYALQVVLHACSRTDGQGKKCNDPIPMFMCDLVNSLEMVARSVRVTTPTMALPKRPDSYGNFLTILAANNIPVGPVVYPKPGSKSDVLKYDVREVDGSLGILGFEAGPNFEEMIVRMMLKIAEEEREKLVRILGRSDCYYCSGDELLRSWASSAVMVK